MGDGKPQAIFMSIGDIDGDATQLVRCNAGDPISKPLPETGWIPLETFHWKVTSPNSTKSGKGPSQNRAPKQVEIDEITVTKRVDRSSAALGNALCTDDKGQDCTIAFLRTGNPGRVYLQYDLKKTLIFHLEMQSNDGDRPVETLKLTFTDMLTTVWQINEANEQQEDMGGKKKQDGSEDDKKLRAGDGKPDRWSVHKTEGAPGHSGGPSHTSNPSHPPSHHGN